jgi:hypothetical protein
MTLTNSTSAMTAATVSSTKIRLMAFHPLSSIALVWPWSYERCLMWESESTYRPHQAPSSPTSRGSRCAVQPVAPLAPRAPNWCPPSAGGASEPLTAIARYGSRIVRYGTSLKRRIFAVAWGGKRVANFLELRKAEVRRIHLPRTWVNSVGCSQGIEGKEQPLDGCQRGFRRST